MPTIENTSERAISSPIQTLGPGGGGGGGSRVVVMVVGVVVVMVMIVVMLVVMIVVVMMVGFGDLVITWLLQVTYY